MSPDRIASQTLELAGLPLVVSTVTGPATTYKSVADEITDQETVDDVAMYVLNSA